VIFFDVPALAVAHGQAGFYAAAYGPASMFRGGTLQRSTNGGVSYGEYAAFFGLTPAKVGQCTTILGTGQTGIWDYSASVTVDMAKSGATLASATDAELANGANLVAIGSRTAGFEVLQFRTATLSSGRYVLTGLLRGLYGTDGKMAGHAANDDFIFLTGLPGIQHVPIALHLTGVSYLYRPTGQGPALRPGPSTAWAATRLPLWPPPASAARCGRKSNGDCLIEWSRGDRYEFSFPDLPDNRTAPMSETSESYEVDILDPYTLAVLRTVTSTTPAITYTQAQQTTDGYPSLVMQDDCSGALTTNFIDNDLGGGASTFSSGVLLQQGWYPGAGANATAKPVIGRAGRTVIVFSLFTTTWVSSSRFMDDAFEIYVHKSSPAFEAAGYRRPEHNAGANSYLALGYYYSNGPRLACKSRISGTEAVLFDEAVNAAANIWTPVAWEIDWTNHRLYLRAAGILVVDASDLVSFSSGLDTPITSSVQVTFCGHSFTNYAYQTDNIQIAAYRSGPSKPIVADIYQLSSLAGRGIARRATL
jgi:hypothetical protein